MWSQQSDHAPLEERRGGRPPDNEQGMRDHLGDPRVAPGSAPVDLAIVVQIVGWTDTPLDQPNDLLPAVDARHRELSADRHVALNPPGQERDRVSRDRWSRGRIVESCRGDHGLRRWDWALANGYPLSESP
jgi:hypothetical protein